MKGVGHMFMIASSALATLACTGCAQLQSLHAGPVSNGTYAYAQNVEAAAPASEGMRFAAPSAYGTDAMAAPSYVAPAIPNYPASKTVYTPLLPGALPEEADRFALTVQTGRQKADPLHASILSESPALLGFIANRNAASLLPYEQVEKDFTAEFAFSASNEMTGLGFDIGLAPRVSYYQAGQFKTRSFGGELRIGQNFDERGTGAQSSSWYVFAGSDGEALIWDTGENGFANVVDSVKLRDQVTIGDIQAGFSIQRGPGQLSLSYIRREVSHVERNVGSISTNEDFAGVSFTLRR